MGDFDDEEGGEWLPGQLGNGRDGPDHGVLIALEMGILLETKDGTISKD
jgi:hypothetical protein